MDRQRPTTVVVVGPILGGRNNCFHLLADYVLSLSLSLSLSLTHSICRQREGYQHGQLSAEFAGHLRGYRGGNAPRSQLEPGEEQRAVSPD